MADDLLGSARRQAEKADPSVSAAALRNMLVHTAHHRAQYEVYLRIKEIKPPDYRF